MSRGRLLVDAFVSEIIHRLAARQSRMSKDIRNYGSKLRVNDLSCWIPCHAIEVAVVAYVLTHIAPFHLQIRA